MDVANLSGRCSYQHSRARPFVPKICAHRRWPGTSQAIGLALVAASRDSLSPLPNGSLGLPIIGETLELLFSGDTFGTTRRQKHGDVYKTHILGAPTVMVYGEDAVRTVLAAEDRLVASDWPQVTSVLVGSESLNLLSGQRHGSVKKALADAFSERQMRRHVPAIANVVQAYVKRWAAEPQPTAGYAACQELSQAVFDIAVLGGDGSTRRAAELQLLTNKLQAGFQTPPLDFPFTDYGKAVAARRAFGALVSEAIARGRAGGAASASSLADVAAAAAGSPDLLPDSLIIDNAAAAFFGNASTGPSLAKALQHLAGSPHVLQQLRQEQQDIIARHGVAITAEALDDMSYAAAVAKELLRITPAVPAVFRVAIVDFELQGNKIPKGWRVWCHLGDSVLKYNKDVFEPNRWKQQPHSAAALSASQPLAATCPAHGKPAQSAANESESTAQAAPEYSLPFGSGVRTCLGRHLVMLELLTMLAVLARGYEWDALNPGEEWRVVPAPAPKAGLLVNLRRRS